jgi:hypothetical protein
MIDALVVLVLRVKALTSWIFCAMKISVSSRIGAPPSLIENSLEYLD